MTNGAVHKDIKTKENFADCHSHNILRLFDTSPNFVFATSETKQDCSNKHSLYELPQELPNDLRLGILENFKKVSEPYRITA